MLDKNAETVTSSTGKGYELTHFITASRMGSSANAV